MFKSLEFKEFWSENDHQVYLEECWAVNRKLYASFSAVVEWFLRGLWLERHQLKISCGSHCNPGDQSITWEKYWSQQQGRKNSMISGIQQCVGKFDIKNKDLIEYLRTSIYLIYTRCLSVWSRPLDRGIQIDLAASIGSFSPNSRIVKQWQL